MDKLRLLVHIYAYLVRLSKWVLFVQRNISCFLWPSVLRIGPHYNSEFSIKRLVLRKLSHIHKFHHDCSAMLEEATIWLALWPTTLLNPTTPCNPLLLGEGCYLNFELDLVSHYWDDSCHTLLWLSCIIPCFCFSDCFGASLIRHH